MQTTLRMRGSGRENGRGLRHVCGNFANIFKITFEISVRNVIGNLVAMGT
jgi:hypothetical protein